MDGPPKKHKRSGFGKDDDSSDEIGRLIDCLKAVLEWIETRKAFGVSYSEEQITDLIRKVISNAAD